MIESDFAYRLQSIGDFGGRSDQLNAYNVYFGDPGHFDTDLGRYRTSDTDAIQSAAQNSLTGNERVALSVIPVEGDLLLGLSDSKPVDVA